jgi:chorismate mutase
MPDQKNIAGLREQINQLDEQIIDLLSERLRLTRKIGVIKDKINKSIIDKDREVDLNARIEKICRHKGLDSSFISNLWQLILQESYRVQNVKK